MFHKLTSNEIAFYQKNLMLVFSMEWKAAVPSGDSIATKISQLFVLDLLYTLIVKEDVTGSQDRKLKTTKALDS